MKNKILIKIIVPSLQESFDVFIPVNEQLWKINKLVTKSIYDLAEHNFDMQNDNYVFINKDTGMVYNNNDIIVDTDIRNATELVMIKSN